MPIHMSLETSLLPESPVTQESSGRESVDGLESYIQTHIRNQSLADFLNEQIAQLGNLDINEPDDSQHMLTVLRRNCEGLNKLQERYKDNNGFDRFSNILMSLTDESKTDFINAISNIDIITLSNYFDTNGLPESTMALDIFGKEFWIALDIKTTHEKKDSALRNIDHANIENLSKIYEAISANSTSSDTFILLKAISGGSIEAYKELRDHLLSNPHELEDLIETVRLSDKANHTNHYETLKYTLESIDPWFTLLINEIELAHNNDELTFPDAYIYSLSGTDIKRNGKIIESSNQYGDNISIDASEKPPLRTLSLNGSDYAIETHAFIGKLHKPEAEYQKQRSDINTKLVSINSLQTLAIQEYIEDLVSHEYSLEQVKLRLKLSFDLDVTHITNLNLLTSPALLRETQKELENQLHDIDDNYKILMVKSIHEHRKEVFESDERSREILKFVSDIWFDRIPKKHTDQLINEIKSWSLLVNGISLDPSKLQLKNGTFWESENERNGTKWKENLIMFFNKMISGSTENPISKESHLWMGGKVEDKNEMRHMLISRWIMNDGGRFNIQRCRKNLRQQEVSES